MPSSIELNIGHVPSPRRARTTAGEDDAAPLRVVAIGDFSGRPGSERAALAERRGLRVDIDNLDAVFARLAPMVAIEGLQDATGVALRLPLATLDDLSADSLAARLPMPSTPAAPAVAPTGDAGEDASATLRRLLGGTVAADAPARAAPAPGSTPDKAGELVDGFIRQLLGSAPAAPLAAPPQPGHDGARAALLRQVLRDPAWRHLEAAWRSVDRFVRELDMADGRVRLELLDCRADELLADLTASGGEPQRSALAPALAGDGRGCAWVVSLEEFGPGLPEQALLGGLARLAMAQGARLLAGAAPALAALATRDAPGSPTATEAAVWQALRESDIAPHVGLTFPRLLARLPYGPQHDPVAAFAFDELADLAPAALHDGLLWRSAALDAARLLVQADVDGTPPARLEDLPAFIDRTGDEPALWPVAEAWLGEGDARRLRAAGFIVLESDRRTPVARIQGWNAIAAAGDDLLAG